MTARNDTLIVAPYIGEFGWELMSWQGRVRRLAERGGYSRMVVCAKPDRRPLYASQGGVTQVVFCPVGKVEAAGQANEDHRIDENGRRLDAEELRRCVCRVAMAACAAFSIPTEGADWLFPDYRGSIWSTATEQSFVRLGAPAEVTTDIVLVPRERSTAAQRNLPASWWEDLAARLAARGLRVEFARPPLDEAIRRFSRARLAIGGSTGGLHLAMLCGCPHYVWGSGEEERWTRLAITNRQRYETFWNPLGTPCLYDECGWQPSVEYIEARALCALERIGRRNDAALRPWKPLRPIWRIKRRLARILESPAPLWPWRVKELVRRRLV